ncbi:carboxypeptidase-like regulatory domain-containing protein [Seonamhaeicola maritimus]|uniref:Carboxypeptidase-like regulatory domain-containing protein n=1 Tax=Seonamhaeicola maritimus TaxID=2591822 RepID=A0A5C7GGL1_9FLAO|nr:carboxypeptidase-like regulatory domain-containing protein [Seonamhaeicola maritimus]TXG36613.1 carboxypeptidase-like regulatory domain-containing protein [Seonamhaeicola maritimus]
MKYSITILLCLVTSTFSFSQESISAKLIDSTNQKPIAFANISFGKKSGVISNSNGDFQIHFKKKISTKDSLFISCLGYRNKSIPVLDFTDNIIFLSQKSIELDEVLVSNKTFTTEEIIEKVNQNLKMNYGFDFDKSKLFYRESYFNKITKNSIDVKESTIPEFNQKFIDSIMTIMPKEADDYTEILGELFTKSAEEETNKLDIIKASHLYDKKKEVSFEGLEKRFNDIFKKHIKRDSYFKIKSGIFGTKEEIDSSFFDSADNKVKKEKEQTEAFLKEQKKREQERKENFLKYRKRTITNLKHDSFIFEDSHLNFLEKSKKYDFEILDYLFLNNNFVYKMSFEPKRGADYKGTLYINTDDFAIIRVDYENIKPIRNFRLLGISYQEKTHNGTLIYSKNGTGVYTLKYAESENENNFGIKRPLKIIEKNKNVKGRRKQNELSTDLHFIMSNITRKELVVFESESIDNATFSAYTETPNVSPTYLPAYDPKFWEGHNVIEPNQAIKDFKSID